MRINTISLFYKLIKNDIRSDLSQQFIQQIRRILFSKKWRLKLKKKKIIYKKYRKFTKTLLYKLLREKYRKPPSFIQEVFKNKLHSDELLYCNGRLKPKYRGVLHAISFCFIPIGFYLLYKRSHSKAGIITSIVVTLAIACCLGISAIYHRLCWSDKYEILLQKIDHACILLVAGGSYFPLTLFCMPKFYGILLMIINFICCIMGFIWILKGKESLIPVLISSLLPLSFFGLVYRRLSLKLFVMALSVIGIYGVGMVIFKTEWPDIWPEYFGYHEIFHIFVVISMLMTFIVHYYTVKMDSWMDV